MILVPDNDWQRYPHVVIPLFHTIPYISKSIIKLENTTNHVFIVTSWFAGLNLTLLIRFHSQCPKVSITRCLKNNIGAQ